MSHLAPTEQRNIQFEINNLHVGQFIAEDFLLKGRYNIGNVGKTDSVSMLTLFESIYIYIH